MQWNIAFSVWLMAGVMVWPARADQRLLIVGESYPPYEYEEDGKAMGFDVQLIDRIMQKLNVPYEIKFYPFPRGWLMVRRGAADAVLSVSYQPEREAVLHYTAGQRAFFASEKIAPDYLWITHYVFFINRRFEPALKFESLDQMRTDGYRVGLLKEYSYTPPFRSWATSAKTAVYTTPADGLRALSRGEIDVLPLDRMVGLELLDDLKLRDTLTYLPPEIFAKPYLLGFGKASAFPGIESVSQRFHAELARMHASGEYAALWAAHMPPLIMGAQRPLVFVCEEWHPFEYLEGDRPTGIDVDAVAFIMRKLGIRHEIRFYPWSRAWMMVTKGAADAVLSVSYNESREEHLFFTPEQRKFAGNGQFPRDYLWMSEYVFFVKKKHAGRLRFDSIEQIKADGYRVGTNKDYSYCPEFLEARLPGRVYNDAEQGMLGLVHDEVDLYPMDRTVGLALLSRLGLGESITMLPRPLLRKPYLAPFSRLSDFPDLERLMYAFYAELAILKQSGIYTDIQRRYGGE
jgi:polar amino acid transport system substrate-binding protein